MLGEATDALLVTAPGRLHQSLDVLLETTYKSHLQQLQNGALSPDLEIPGIQLQLESPTLGIDYQRAVGFTDRAHNIDRQPLTVQHPMRIASITKTFVAAAILRLWEQGNIALDQSITGYIAPEHLRLMQQYHYDLSTITIRHLLSHTSGLFDYADSETFYQQFHQQPQHQWTRTEQLQLAMEEGEPYGRPGEVFRYSDTGYNLLGEIIERCYGEDLGASLQALIGYKALGLQSTCLEKNERPPEHSLPNVHQYDHELDSTALDASFDSYGGGGLVSTVGDLCRFMRGLFSGGIYKQSNTLLTMLSTVPAKQGGPDAYGVSKQIPGSYRLGIEAGEHGQILGHSGYFGTYAAFIPHLDCTVSLSINIESKALRGSLIKQLHQTLNLPV